MAQHSVPPAPAPAGRTSRAALAGWVVAGAVGLLALVLLAGMLVGGGGAAVAPSAAAPAAAVPAAPSAVAAVSDLPVSSTYTTVDAAPADSAPDAVNDGVVVHPVRETLVLDAPGGTPVARMETEQIGDTWLPVVAEDGEWLQVLLPSRPNRTAGWIAAADVERASTPYRIDVHLGSRTLELLRDGERIGQWTVGIGREATPTPTGRTFLLGAFTDPGQDYSPVILPLGTHSPTHDTFGGGPGTVAIHTWPTDDVFGEAGSDGCIRVPQDALDLLTGVPLGTLVMIDEG